MGRYLVYRLYKEEGLTLRQCLRRRRRVAVHRRERQKPTGPNQVWSLDFVADQLADGRRFRALTVVDVFTRESLANPLWGAPRIHGDLLKLGMDLSQAAVAKYMERPRKPPSPMWRTFLDRHLKRWVSTGFFEVPTLNFRILFVFVVLARHRRRGIDFNVTAHFTPEWTAQQIADAFPWDTAPRSNRIPIISTGRARICRWPKMPLYHEPFNRRTGFRGGDPGSGRAPSPVRTTSCLKKHSLQTILSLLPFALKPRGSTKEPRAEFRRGLLG